MNLKKRDQVSNSSGSLANSTGEEDSSLSQEGSGNTSSNWCSPLREPYTIDGGDPGGGLSSSSSSFADTWGTGIYSGDL